MNLFKKLKSTLLATLALAITAAPLSVPTNTTADTQDIINPLKPTELSDGTILSKTAAPVDKQANVYDITLRIESLAEQVPSDTILLVDNSGSVSGSSFRKLQNAARHLSGKLLTNGSGQNRVAVMTFSDFTSVWSGFSNNIQEVINRINNVRSPYGLTNMTSGLYVAGKYMDASTASVKTIVLLTDGMPTVGNLSVIEKYATGCKSEIENAAKNNASKTRFSSCDLASSRIFKPETSEITNMIETFVNNSSSKNYIYTIGFNYTPSWIIDAMGNHGEFFTTSDIDKIMGIYDQIASNILSHVKVASVDDPMGDGFVISDPNAADSVCLRQDVTCDGNKKITWTPTFVYDATLKKYVSEITYRIEANDDILSITPDSDGYYSLNGDTVITYNGNKTGKFPSPKAKPGIMSVTKKVINNTDIKEDPNAEFRITVSGPNGFSKPLTLKNGETQNFTGPLLEGTYTVAETDSIGNNIPFVDYVQSYTINGNKGREFEVVSGQLNTANFVVTNTFESKNIEVKIKWEDNDNAYKTRPNDVYVELLDDNATIDTANIDEAGDGSCGAWCKTFANLPVRYNGSEIQYSISQDKVDKYLVPVVSTTDRGFEILNVHLSGNGNGIIEPNNDNILPAQPNTGSLTKESSSTASAANNSIVALIAISTISAILGVVFIVKRQKATPATKSNKKATTATKSSSRFNKRYLSRKALAKA